MRPTNDQVKAKRARIKAAYQRLFMMPEAELVMRDLDEQFNQSTLKRQGNTVDPYGSIAAAGSREVLLYIDYMMEKESDAVTE